MKPHNLDERSTNTLRMFRITGEESDSFELGMFKCYEFLSYQQESKLLGDEIRVLKIRLSDRAKKGTWGICPRFTLAFLFYFFILSTFIELIFII